MKYSYQISGMTCNGCRASVEKKLSALNGVNTVDVHLEKNEATLDTNFEIPISQLKDALSTKYGIEKKEHLDVFNIDINSHDIAVQEKTKLQQLQPLLIILGYISIASVLLNYKDWNGNAAMLDFMGLFYIVFSFFKIIDIKGFPDSFRMYDPLAKSIPVYAWIYPFVETALGLMFLMRFKIGIALVVTLVILGVTTLGVAKTLLSKQKIQCACLGTALKLPMTEATLIENVIMITMAVILLIQFL